MDNSSDSDTKPWVTWFCELRGNEFFCAVPVEYIEDNFNLYGACCGQRFILTARMPCLTRFSAVVLFSRLALMPSTTTGLASLVPHYELALDTILDYDIDFDKVLPSEDAVEAAAESLYGLIHARYIITARGMRDMARKYNKAMFGRCHRVSCQGQRVLPVGQSDIPRLTTVNVFCPRCKQIYFPKSRRQGNIDGAFFGTTFAHLYVMTFPEPPPEEVMPPYEPRVFGFRINKNSAYWKGRAK